MPSESAAPPKALAGQYRFGGFRLDAATPALYRGGEFIPLTPKAAEILLLLVQEAGRVVTREQMLQRVWPGVIVEEGVIANNISALRRILDGEFEGDSPIVTVPRRGYRFTPPVRADEGDTILVAEIENLTGDPVFDGTMRQALLLHLTQSRSLEILSDRKVLSVLGYMGKPGEAITGDVALEICQRTGCKCAITGSIFEVGGEYVIALQALHGETGDMLVMEQARAHGKSEVLGALDRAAVGLRTMLGESLASVSRTRPFEEVATSSLEALKAYAVGRVEWGLHGEAAGMPHFLRAIELDPNFCSCLASLALGCMNMGQMQEATRYMRKAYDLRESATERERVRMVASYHGIVTGDLFKGIDAHRVWQTTFPREGAAYLNGANLLMMGGQWDKALTASQRSHAMEPSAVSASNLAIALLAVGRHDEARAMLDDAFARGYEAFYLHLDAYQEAFLRRDAEAMRRHADAVAGREGEEDFLIGAQADTEACFGRFERSRALSRRAVESARHAGSLEMAAMWEAQAALREAEVGEAARAREGAVAALETFAGREVQGMAGLALARSGDVPRAMEIAASLEREYPTHTIVQSTWLPCIRAALAIGRRDWSAAVEALEISVSVELGVTTPFEGGFMLAPYLRGLALLGGGRSRDAAREFGKIVERPGLIKNFVVFPLAHLGASKAAALDGSGAEAASLKATFDAMWKGDQKSPIVAP
jgi:DNA-binding winged helix-turn-helix (wHTH) protein/tetratricopeptide (TPR) repeat protein